jgi:flagellar biosynthesis/type III secretory pathway protein FliH
MATIIRKHSVTEEPSGRSVQPVEFNFEDMNDRANEYLETVRREAAKIVQQAHQQAEQIRRQAETAGRAAAEEGAQRALDERLASRVATFVAALDQLVVETNDAKADWLRRWEQSAVAVAAAIAERIIRREIRAQPELTIELVREALRLASGAVDVTLYLNPSDYELLGGEADALAQSLGRLAPTRIAANPNVSAGGCLVETALGQIDQRIESQLARIQEELS